MKGLSRVVAVLAVILAVGATLLAPSASALAGSAWVWPLQPVPHVIRRFEPPSSPYGPGHRGVDLAGAVGQPVLAVASGTVTFAGSVAGRGVVVVDHGRVSSTYQPVYAFVPVGAPVAAGQPVGFLEVVGSHCLPDACLHLGARRGATYLDPLRLLPARPVRLKPLGGLAGLAAEPPRGLLPPRDDGAGAAAQGVQIGLLAGGAPLP